MASLTAQQLAQMYAGNGPLAMPSYTMEDIYGGILPSSGGNGATALQEIDRALANAPAQRWAVDANGQRVDPIGYVPTTGGGAATSSMPALPRIRPTSAPNRIDMAAINAPSGVSGLPTTTRVTGQMKPAGWRGLDILSLLTGPSKNGLSGLPGLLGGPQQGGILQMLFGGGKSTAGLPRAPAAMTPAQRYAAANSGAGSVAAMERRHSGQSLNPQSGGPAVGGEYGGGASNSGNAFDGSGNYQYRGR